MKKRYKKKRKQQQYIEGLERGNQYLADLVGRMMEEKAAMQRGLQQIESCYQRYILVLVNDLGGEVIIDRVAMAELNDKAELIAQIEGNDKIGFTVMDREQA